MANETDSTDANDDTSRYCEALSANLHTIFFFSSLNDDDKARSAVRAINTAIDQVGEPAVRCSFGAMHAMLRDRVKKVFP